MPPAINGALAGLTAAAISLLAVVCVTVLGWVLAADHSSLGSMFDIAAYGWLSIHLVPLETAAGWLWLPPLTLTAGVGWLAYAVGKSAARRGALPDSATRWRVIGSGVTVYAVFATVLATLSATASASVPLALAPFAAGAVFAAGFASAILSRCGGGRQLATRIPPYLRAEAKAALVGLAVLAGIALVVLIVALALGRQEVATMGLEVRPGFSGTFVLTLASLVYLPTAVIWVASFLAGPGVSLGAEGLVAPWGIVGQDLPFFPLLAALPESWQWWFYCGLAAPLVAGIVAAVRSPEPVCVGRSGKVASVGRVAGLAAAVAGLAALLAMGTLGGRLSGLGPAPALVAGAVGAWFLLGAMLVAVVRWLLLATADGRSRARARLRWRSRRPAQQAAADSAPQGDLDVAEVSSEAGVDLVVADEVPAPVPALDRDPIGVALAVGLDLTAPERPVAADDGPGTERDAIAALLAAGATVKFESALVVDAEAATSVAPAWLVAEGEADAQAAAAVGEADDAGAAAIADASLWLDLELPPYVDDATVVLTDPHAPDLAPVES